MLAYAGPMLGLYSVRWAASGGPTWVHLPTCHLQPLTDRSWVPSNSIPVLAIPCRPCLENISAPSVDSSQSGAGIGETSQVQDEVGSRHRAVRGEDRRRGHETLCLPGHHQRRILLPWIRRQARPGCELAPSVCRSGTDIYTVFFAIRRAYLCICTIHCQSHQFMTYDSHFSTH